MFVVRISCNDDKSVYGSDDMLVLRSLSIEGTNTTFFKCSVYPMNVHWGCKYPIFEHMKESVTFFITVI